ncbi:hypothetical protein ANT2_4567 [plant metagenome]|uniref:Uncharacterized protein n=1 Tax=plant metagenome TaxID=1297885 RepID=A0A484RC20_9ZZZZ
MFDDTRNQYFSSRMIVDYGLTQFRKFALFPEHLKMIQFFS